MQQSLKNYVYLYDETVASKGADEIVSMLYMYFNEKLSDIIKILDVWSDGKASQVWNNIAMLFLEQVTDPNSIFHKALPKLKWLTQKPSWAHRHGNGL